MDGKKMKPIICPYCCSRYTEPGEFSMWFRSEQGENELDTHLKDYYCKFERMNEDEAEKLAQRKKRAIHVNGAEDTGKMRDYDAKQLEEYGFVKTLRYNGEKLWQRLCPHCHNELVQDAGFVDMKMIGMYGDTSVGKTVYLTVLEAILKKDPLLGETANTGFYGTLQYLGSKEAAQAHREDYDRLIEDRVLYEATQAKKRVKPQSFRFTYKTAKTDRHEQEKQMVLVFCDIPGEDTRSAEELRISGFYLQNVDGLLLLFDPTRLSGALPYVRGTMNDPKENVRLEAVESLGQLADYLKEENGGRKSAIPAAVVITKMDALEDLKNHGMIGEELKQIYVEDANRLHEKFLNRKVIVELDRTVKKLISKLGGEVLCTKVDEFLAVQSYFAVSAIGKTPQEETIEEEGVLKTIKRVPGNLEPFRVTEPFYWLMSQFDCIPYHYRERWKYLKKRLFGKLEERTATVQFYYYESERERTAKKKLEEKRKEKEINPLDDHWKLIKRDSSI